MFTVKQIANCLHTRALRTVNLRETLAQEVLARTNSLVAIPDNSIVAFPSNEEAI
jgi:hypothetical protein